MTPEPQPYSRYVTMVDEILENVKLTPFQKILWALIDTLSKKGDVCTASNAFLAKKMNTSQGNLANEVSKLRALGYLLDEELENGRRGLVTVYEGDRRIQKMMAHRVQSQLNKPSVTTEPLFSHSLSKRGAPNIVEINLENKERVKASMEELKGRLKTLFKRKTNERWSDFEEHYIYSLSNERQEVLSEMNEIEALYANPAGHYTSDSAAKLLEHWTEMLDKSRNPKKNGNQSNQTVDRNAGTYNDGNFEKYKHLVAGYKKPE